MPFFDAGARVKLQLNEFSYIEVMARKTVGVCTWQGDYVKAQFDFRKPGSWRIAAMAHGSRYCEDKDNRDQIRFNFTASLEDFMVAGGRFRIHDTTAIILAKGVFIDSYDLKAVDLKEMEWNVYVRGNVHMSGIAGLTVDGHAEADFFLPRASEPEKKQSPADYYVSFGGIADDANFQLTRVGISAGVSWIVGLGGAKLAVAANGTFQWPCVSFIELEGTLSARFNELLDFGELQAYVRVECPALDPSVMYQVQMYTNESVFDMQAEGVSCIYNATAGYDPLFLDGHVYSSAHTRWQAEFDETDARDWQGLTLVHFSDQLKHSFRDESAAFSGKAP